MAIYRTFILYQGTTFCENFDLTDVYSQSINLSNYSVVSRMARDAFSDTYTELHAEIIDYIKGKIQISLSATETANLYPGRYLIEVLLIDSYEVITKLIEGIVDVVPGIGLSVKTYLE